MPLPATWNTVTVTATFLKPNGTPASGSVQFTAVRAVGMDDTIVLPHPITAVLDSSGQITASLPCPDDAGAGYTTLVYLVKERTQFGRDEYFIELDNAMTSIELEDVPRVAPLSEDQGYVLAAQAHAAAAMADAASASASAGVATTQAGIATTQASAADSSATAADASADAAAASESNASSAAASAMASASTAESVAGPTYASQALGEAATVDGESFAVDNGDGTASIYLRTSGGSTLQRTLATTAALAADIGSALVGFKQSGTGAVARTVQEKARELALSVTDFATIADAAAAADAAAGAMVGLNPTNTVTLVFPGGVAHTTSSTLTFSGKYNIRMDGRLTYTGVANEPAIVIGGVGGIISGRDHVINVDRQTQSDWSSEDCIGVKLVNHNSSNIRIVNANKFTIGVQCLGDSGGFAYNNITLGVVNSNKYGVDCTNADTTGVGWCNENIFTNGRFSVDSGINTTQARYGVRSNSIGTTKYYNNNNVFVKPSFELNAPNASGEAVAILMAYGTSHHFIELRTEGCDLPVMRQENDSTENTVVFGYARSGTENFPDSQVVQTTGPYPSCTITRNRSRHSDGVNRLVFDSGPVHKSACYYDGATKVHVPRVQMQSGGSTVVLNAQDGFTLNADYLEIPATRSLGVRINTTACKTFCIRRDVESSHPGRVYVQCFDAAGARLTSAGPNHPYVKGALGAPASYSANFTGCYGTGSDTAIDYWVTLHDDVKSIIVNVIGGTAACRIRGFKVFSGDYRSSPSAWVDYEQVVPGANIGTTAPTAGTWAAGRRVMNAAPAANGPSGWVCTAAGTPGTWAAFGPIESVLSASKVHDWPDLPTATQQTTTVTVTGAALGDYAEAAINLSLAGSTMYAYVSAADTVTVIHRNDTGANVNVGNASLRVRVRKA